MSQFTPHVTTAWVIQAQGKYLLVEEYPQGQQCFNQPAGHIEQGETIIECAKRELFEETGLSHIEPQGLVGIYQMEGKENGITYLRFCFAACLPNCEPITPRDSDIHAGHWLSKQQLQTLPLRSPLVMRCIDDFEQQPLFSLKILNN